MNNLILNDKPIVTLELRLVTMYVMHPQINHVSTTCLIYILLLILK